MGPTEDSVENRPARAVELVLGVAAVQMPDVSSDIIGSRTVTRSSGIVNICTQTIKMSDIYSNASRAFSVQFVEGVGLESTDGLAEETSAD